MSDFDDAFDNGIECPNCGFTQTEPSRHNKKKWFCFLCGMIWNPEEESEYDQGAEAWADGRFDYDR